MYCRKIFASHIFFMSKELQQITMLDAMFCSWLLDRGECDNLEPILVVTGHVREVVTHVAVIQISSMLSQTGDKKEVFTDGRDL